jgi:hypothetical protein
MPGLAVMAMYDEERDEAVKKSHVNAIELLEECESSKK